jgi:hypothetical protein
MTVSRGTRRRPVLSIVGEAPERSLLERCELGELQAYTEERAYPLDHCIEQVFHLVGEVSTRGSAATENAPGVMPPNGLNAYRAGRRNAAADESVGWRCGVS